MFIEQDPDRAGGKPVLQGTRFTVAQLLAELAEGRTLDELAQDAGLDRQVMVGALRELALKVPSTAEPELLPVLLWCPECGARHIDEHEFETRPHHTHACQACGMVWRPAKVPTVGVRFLPGFGPR